MAHLLRQSVGDVYVDPHEVFPIEKSHKELVHGGTVV